MYILEGNFIHLLTSGIIIDSFKRYWYISIDIFYWLTIITENTDKHFILHF